ncbi:acyl-CoA carboxylase epsilon subunit [Streptomyces sp. CRN 30]|uniref:acyl-CoA carboxylase epsilon subunit n=1 Tax=Streptomyces sp. CRN 30 TaxID=3075613 RepID=UPI002A7F9DBF|nr:acyl-CoA carboxylase epsilon subunit [Streptomyces sp. CRN 30]
MERVTRETGPEETGAAETGTVRVLRGTPDAHETAALLVLLARLGGAARQEEPRPAVRPVWEPFTEHAPGGWRNT